MTFVNITLSRTGAVVPKKGEGGVPPHRPDFDRGPLARPPPSCGLPPPAAIHRSKSDRNANRRYLSRLLRVLKIAPLNVAAMQIVFRRRKRTLTLTLWVRCAA
jgi:hypothetical protein